MIVDYYKCIIDQQKLKNSTQIKIWKPKYSTFNQDIIDEHERPHGINFINYEYKKLWNSKQNESEDGYKVEFWKFFYIWVKG